MHHLTSSFFVSVTLLSVACGGENAANRTDAATSPSSSTAAGSPSATGDTLVVEMYSDAAGNYFKPNEVEAKRGDVIRFVLKSGVHNVHFHPDSNAIKTGLPPASEMLQLPEQTHDVVVTQSEGKYRFQCDPHAALGMKGELEVEEH